MSRSVEDNGEPFDQQCESRIDASDVVAAWLLAALIILSLLLVA